MKEYQKVYLVPQILRRGAPVLKYVTSEQSVTNETKRLYFLGIYHDLIPGLPAPYKGQGREYAATSKSAISKEFFDAFVKEAKRNFRRFKLTVVSVGDDGPHRLAKK